MRDVSTSPDPRSHRLARLGASRPWLLDIAIVAAIVAIGTLGGPHRHGDLDGRLFTVALPLPLLVRRRYPVGVFAVISAIALVQWLADVRVLRRQRAAGRALHRRGHAAAADHARGRRRGRDRRRPRRRTLGRPALAGGVRRPVGHGHGGGGPGASTSVTAAPRSPPAGARRATGVRARPAGPPRGRRRALPHRARDARHRRAQPVGDDRARRRCELRRARCSRPGRGGDADRVAHGPPGAQRDAASPGRAARGAEPAGARAAAGHRRDRRS